MGIGLGILKWLFASKSGIIVILVVALVGVSFYAKLEHSKATSIEATTKLSYEKASQKADQAAAEALKKKLVAQKAHYEKLLESQRRAEEALAKTNDLTSEKFKQTKEELKKVYEKNKETRSWRDTPIPPDIICSLRDASNNTPCEDNQDIGAN